MLNFSQKLFAVVFLYVLTLGAGASVAEAGFGITPPYVKNTSLTRGSIYEQEILLVRGDTKHSQTAEIIVDAPYIEDWIEIVEGYEIPMPRGEQKVPMTVRIKVPTNADFEEYTGSIRIRTIPDKAELNPSSVNISLGALVDIELNVIDREIKDFRVRKISAADINEGKKTAWLFFPGKINFDMMIENTGNVDIAPSEVQFRIFDRAGKILLEESTNIGRIDRIKPYATESVTAEIPTSLPAGSYVVRYAIHNDDDVKQEGDLSLNILPNGTVQTAGFGFVGLSIAHKVSVLLPIFAAIIAGIYFFRSRTVKKTVRRSRS